MLKVLRYATATFVIATLAATPARSQEWPTKPVRIVVAFASGGTADIFARMLTPELSATFKQPFYVENKPGNSGAIGATQVARAEPDGYTLMIGGSGPHLTAPAINPNIGYDPLRDFTHIAMIGGDSYMLVVNPALGVKTFSEFVQLARSKAITCGSPGSGSLGHLLQEQLNRKVGIALQHVPYRGSGESVSDLLGNHVSSILQPIIAIGEQVRSGKLIGLAVSSTERNPAFKDIPTFAELGYPDVRGSTWFWLTAPKNLPADITNRLQREVRRIIGLPAIRRHFENGALLTMDVDTATLNKFLAEELALWGPLAKSIGLKVQ